MQPKLVFSEQEEQVEQKSRSKCLLWPGSEPEPFKILAVQRANH